MSYEVNILVNGSRCKQYQHNGLTYVEAKKGSEYTIEIKNNTWQRILAVCSVDGLDILNGKPALESNPGYVIDGYSSGKFDGFRVSDSQVAKFLFDYKGSSYAASKEDGSERNVGVIGVRIYTEKVKPPPVTIREEHHHHHHHDHYHDDYWRRPWTTGNPPIIWCGGLTKDADLGSTICNSGTDSLGSTLDCYDSAEYERGPVKYSGDSIPTKSSSGIGQTKSATYGSTKGSSNASSEFMGRFKKLAGTKSSNEVKTRSFGGDQSCLRSSEPDPRGFDMGTKWGEAKESRVIEVEFERGTLALTTNIYYASRKSLVEMGIPLGSEKQVSFPEPFRDSKYAQPPKNWQG